MNARFRDIQADSPFGFGVVRVVLVFVEVTSQCQSGGLAYIDMAVGYCVERPQIGSPSEMRVFNHRPIRGFRALIVSLVRRELHAYGIVLENGFDDAHYPTAAIAATFHSNTHADARVFDHGIVAHDKQSLSLGTGSRLVLRIDAD